MVPASVTLCPGFTGFGDADAVAVGGVGCVLKVAATLTLSIATPSSDPAVSTSIHRIQIEDPGLTVRPVIVPLTVVRQAGEFPLVAPLVAQALPSGVKLRAGTAVNVPVVRSAALTL